MKKRWFLNVTGLRWIAVTVAKTSNWFKTGTVKEEVTLSPLWDLSCLTSALFPWRAAGARSLLSASPVLLTPGRLQRWREGCLVVGDYLGELYGSLHLCTEKYLIGVVGYYLSPSSAGQRTKLKLTSLITSKGVIEWSRTRSWTQVSHFPTSLASVVRLGMTSPFR